MNNETNQCYLRNSNQMLKLNRGATLIELLLVIAMFIMLLTASCGNTLYTGP